MPCTAIESRRMLSVLCGEGDGRGSNVPAVQVVLFQFFLFRGGRLLLPRGPRTGCTGARRLNTIETEKTKFRPCKISGLLLTRELALCALTTSAGFTENVWSVTCMRNQTEIGRAHV